MFLRDISVLQELWWSVTLSLVLGFSVVQGPHQREMPEEVFGSLSIRLSQAKPRACSPWLMTVMATRGLLSRSARCRRQGSSWSGEQSLETVSRWNKTFHLPEPSQGLHHKMDNLMYLGCREETSKGRGGTCVHVSRVAGTYINAPQILEWPMSNQIMYLQIQRAVCETVSGLGCSPGGRESSPHAHSVPQL